MVKTRAASGEVAWACTNALGDAKGSPVGSRNEVPGRPSRDGRSYVSATLADGARGRIVVMGFDRSTRDRRFARELQLGMPVMNVLLIDTDASGIIYLAALGERAPGGRGEPQATVDLYCLDPVDGRPLSRTELTRAARELPDSLVDPGAQGDDRIASRA